MSLLCSWLNDEVGLSVPTSPANFNVIFSNGFYLGELLVKLNCLSAGDLARFKNDRKPDTLVNNFKEISECLKQIGK